MPEPLKYIYSAAFLSLYSDALDTVLQEFNRKSFLSAFAGEPWEKLELKQRIGWLAEQTDRELPKDFKGKTEMIFNLIDFLRSKGVRDQNFEFIFLCDIIAKHGLNDLPTSLKVIEKITPFTSFEFAGRIFFQHFPEEMMAQMLRWAEHSDPNVRRYASEGCRPRLPWGMQLKSFVNNPRPIFPVLEKLMNDSSEYVRKSVANNLNDISTIL